MEWPRSGVFNEGVNLLKGDHSGAEVWPNEEFRPEIISTQTLWGALRPIRSRPRTCTTGPSQGASSASDNDVGFPHRGHVHTASVWMKPCSAVFESWDWTPSKVQREDEEDGLMQREHQPERISVLGRLIVKMGLPVIKNKWNCLSISKRLHTPFGCVRRD